MTDTTQPQVLEFSGYRLNLARRTLVGPDGGQISLKPRVFDTLAVLAARPGELVTRRALMDAVWPNVIVEENNLNQAIVALRRALGEGPDGAGFIATLPGRGYQFVAPVTRRSEPPAPADETPLEADVTPPETAVTSAGRRHQRELLAGIAVAVIAAVAAVALWLAQSRATAAPRASIAVLPFVNLSADPEQEYFSDGLADEVLNQLARIENLRVIARTSSFQFKDQAQDARAVGKALGASHILEGSVRRAGDTLRITAQLISTSDGGEQLSVAFERKLDDVFAIQKEIAGAVARHLRYALDTSSTGPDTGGTSKFEAYDHLLRGRSLVAHYNEAAVEAAVAEFRQAVAIDPDYGVAWAALSDAAHILALHKPFRSAELIPLREMAVQRALEKSPDRWQVHALLGNFLWYQRDWDGAARAWAEARRLVPAEEELWEGGYGDYLSQVGRIRDAFNGYLALRDRDPLSAKSAVAVAWGLDIQGRPPEASAEYTRSLTLGTSANFGALLHLDRLLRTGDHDATRAFLAEFPDQRPGRQAFAREFATAWTDRQAALAVIRSLRTNPDFNGPNNLPGFAVIAAHYGDYALAIDMFREDYLERGGIFYVFLWSVDMAQARRTPAFRKLVRDVGLVDYWRKSGNWGDYCKPVGSDDFECW